MPVLMRKIQSDLHGLKWFKRRRESNEEEM
jgi:hypothetical protein